MVDFVFLAEQSENKRKQKVDKYLDLTRKLKKLQIIRVMVIPIVVGALGTVLKCLKIRLEELEIKGRIKTV